MILVVKADFSENEKWYHTKISQNVLKEWQDISHQPEFHISFDRELTNGYLGKVLIYIKVDVVSMLFESPMLVCLHCYLYSKAMS